jgi:hypothetical protein
MRRYQQISIVAALTLLLLCVETAAQLVTGSISGSVTDASGGAKVTVINERTGGEPDCDHQKATEQQQPQVPESE